MEATEALGSAPFSGNGLPAAATDPLHALALVDPTLADGMEKALADRSGPLPGKTVRGMVEEILRAISQEIGFGYALAEGLLTLAGEASASALERYLAVIRKAGREGPTLGRLLAVHLVPAFRRDAPALVDRILETAGVMGARGTHTLNSPLEATADLIDAGDLPAAEAFLNLLREVFSRQMSYSRSLHLAHGLPRAVKGFPTAGRTFRIEALGRVAAADAALIDPFLEGMAGGLAILDPAALGRFLTEALEVHGRRPESGRRFLSLESKPGREAFRGLQVTVPLVQVRAGLNRYLRARSGGTLSVRPLAALPRSLADDRDGEAAMVRSDGRHVYLPETVGRSRDRAGNLALYKALVRLEATPYECGTFDFDLDRLAEAAGGAAVPAAPPDVEPHPGGDLGRFFDAFPLPALAGDLFSIFEIGRIRKWLTNRYPGIARAVFPLLGREALRSYAEQGGRHPLQPLYLRVAAGLSPADPTSIPPAPADRWFERFEREMAGDGPAEGSGRLTLGAYPAMERSVRGLAEPGNGPTTYRPLPFPFGFRIRPELFFATFREPERTAGAVRRALAERGVSVFKSEIRNHLVKTGGALFAEDLAAMVRHRKGSDGPDRDEAPSVHLSRLDLSAFLDPPSPSPAPMEADGGTAVWYDEWDHRLNDYLHDHVRVRERSLPEFDDGFYGAALARRRGLVRRVRRAFELLRPEGLVRLRRWPEGDSFDDAALIDFAVDRRAGRSPSDRIYIKRIKQERSVAALLLVDLSRSTANLAAGSNPSGARILDVEKEAVVLFCEALAVVGDAFAVAGFSGTGRLGVDYYPVKGFQDPLDGPVMGRIGALAPQRNTRTGAAVRHAASRLQAMEAKVRVLLILGDGFPNDTDYKKAYAIEDTRRAILESAAKGIHARAITVNMAGDGRLDDLYGPLHHNVISDVRDLPDRLLGIYGALTR